MQSDEIAEQSCLEEVLKALKQGAKAEQLRPSREARRRIMEREGKVQRAKSDPMWTSWLRCRASIGTASTVCEVSTYILDIVQLTAYTTQKRLKQLVRNAKRFSAASNWFLRSCSLRLYPRDCANSTRRWPWNNSMWTLRTTLGLAVASTCLHGWL